MVPFQTLKSFIYLEYIITIISKEFNEFYTLVTERHMNALRGWDFTIVLPVLRQYANLIVIVITPYRLVYSGLARFP